MKVTKKTRLLAKPVPIFEDPAIGLKVFSIEGADGGKPKIGQEPWIMRGEGIRLADEQNAGFAPSDEFYTIGEDYHGSFTLTPAADGKSATLRLQPLEPLDDLPAGEHSARFLTTTYKENFEISKSGDFPFVMVKE